MDADVAAAREARYIAAFEPEVQDLSESNRNKDEKTFRGAMEVTSLMQQLEDGATLCSGRS